ncbi:MAG: NAD-dependent protein deacylase [Clostridia bacterium]|nr:NAD-dependent protein deacylase [Clostridia bacterium]
MYNELKKIVLESNNIVFFGGAGVSTESNIPDFRSEAGLYNAIQKYSHPPEEMLSRTFFTNNTDTFFDFYKNEMIYESAEPNDAHKALAQLEAEGKIKAVITQNIDGLHQKAGSKNVYELHGSVYRNYCMSCNTFYGLHQVIASKKIPICTVCGGIIKPDVVLYEEALNEDVLNDSIIALQSADTLIIGGTSLLVYPAAGLVNYFKGEHLVLINKGETAYDDRADVIINDSIGEVFKEIRK